MLKPSSKSGKRPGDDCKGNIVSTQLIRRIVTVDWPKQAQADAKTLLIDVAQTGHLKIMRDAAVQGLEPTWEAYANSPGNSDLQSVRLPGPIVYNYRYLSELIQFALDELRRQSPVVSGAYRDSHTIYVNDQPQGQTIPKTINAGDRIFISNPVPYARRLEVGRRKGGEPFLISVPNRIYYRVTEMVKAEAKGRGKVSGGYVDLGVWSLKNDQKSLVKTATGYRHSARQRLDRVAGSAVTSPAIFFKAPI
jgi:hypothetical protein